MGRKNVKEEEGFQKYVGENMCNHLLVTSYTLWGRNSKAYSFQTKEIDFTE